MPWKTPSAFKNPAFFGTFLSPAAYASTGLPSKKTHYNKPILANPPNSNLCFFVFLFFLIFSQQ
jgi:hypothetical protein